MEEQLSYKELNRAKEELEKKVKNLTKEINELTAGKSGDSALFSELFKKHNCIILFQKEKKGSEPQGIILANPAAIKSLGYSAEEFRKLTISDLIEREPANLHQGEIKSESIFQEQKILITKNRKSFPCEIHSHELNVNGIKHTLFVIQDLTRQMVLRETLRSREDKFKRLINSLGTEFLYFNRDIHGMNTFISPSVENLLGYSQEEAQRNFREFLTDAEINKKALAHSELSLKGIKQPPFRSEVYHRDGSTRSFYNIEIPVLDKTGKVIAVEGLSRDITEELKSREYLRQQEELFHLMIETIEEVFWTFDLKSDKLLYISPKYEKVYGNPIKLLYSKPGSFLKTVSAEDIPMVKNAYKQLEKGKGFDIEYRLKMPDNSVRWIWSRSFIITDNKKKPSLVLGTALDITERKRVQLDTNLLAAIVENTEDHAVIKDTNLRIIASNRANTIAAGKKNADELIGKTDIEIYGDHSHVRQYVEDDKKALLLKKGQTLVNEQIFVYPDGRTIHSLIKKFPVFDEKNKLIAIAGISRDITDYKKALQSLSESEKKFRFLIENQSEGVGILDPKNRFTFINPATEKIFGTEKGKMINKSLLQFVNRENKALLTENFKKLVESDTVTFEISINKKGIETATILVTATMLKKDNKTTGIFIVFNDITTFRKTEEALLKSEKELQISNAEKDKFFSIIAHDLKNPFHSILNLSDLLLKHYSTYDKEEVLTFIKMIHDSSSQAFSLLENLLHWSRARSGRMDLLPEKVDLNSVVTDNICLLEISATEKNIKLTNSVKPKTFVECDANMISTVIRNIISNAIKFTRPTGKINITSRENANTCEISITDTGVGISEENLGKLFRIDTHFSTTGTANEEGTGLGLILCKEFINLNKGSIRVVSKPGKGSTFTVELPKAPSQKTINT
jgi:PAS domain S-box-containing protein